MKLPPGYVAGKGVVEGTAYGGFGERMLQSLGWEKGKGLGKQEQGMKEAIEVKKKDDTLGVGGRPSTNWKDAWWEDAFNAAVKNVNHGRTHSSSSDSSSSDSSDNDMDTGDIEEVGLKRRHRDGTMASASAEELKILKALNKSQGRVSTGRFGGRDAKMERIRRQEELEAARVAERLNGPVPGKEDVTSDVCEVVVEKQSSSKGTNTRIVIECGGSQENLTTSMILRPTPRDGWWGCKLFLSAGCMSGAALELPVKDSERDGFSESQQARIYENAQKGKSTGKTGLGKGKRGTIKIQGLAWEGRKTTFSDDDEGMTNKGDGVPQGKSGFTEWKKVVSKVLKKKAKSKKRMKMKSLNSSVKKMVASVYNIKLKKDEVTNGIQKILVDHSDTFSVSGDYVYLC